MEICVGTHLADKNIFLILGLLLVATACQSESGASLTEVNVGPPADMATMKLPDPTQKAEEAEPLSPPQPRRNLPPTVINRQFIRNAQLCIHVNDFTASGKNSEQGVQKAGGLNARTRLMGNVLSGAIYFLPVGLVIFFIIWLIQRWRRQKQQAKVSAE